MAFYRFDPEVRTRMHLLEEDDERWAAFKEALVARVIKVQPDGMTFADLGPSRFNERCSAILTEMGV